MQPADPGWYRFDAPEHYDFSMPGVPQVADEQFAFDGTSVPERSFELTSEASSRGYELRVFDARRLDPSDREALAARPSGSSSRREPTSRSARTWSIAAWRWSSSSSTG